MQAADIPLLGKIRVAVVGVILLFMPMLGHGFPNIDGDNIDGAAVLQTYRYSSYAWCLEGSKM